ncbi:DeoR family transcriptional regulator, partial [Turicibacter sanguinis]|nr:DeoR family transcriptional regulator [Turicibacter sanguinis]
MITEERHQLIITELKQKGSVKVSDLVERFNISESTIRRDLVFLENLNYLKRVHGGAVNVKNKF